MEINKVSLSDISGLLPWQSENWSRLLPKIIDNKIAHAYLFTGVKGIGKRHFAYKFAQALLCESFSVPNKASVMTDNVSSLACGHCKQCRLFESETHPDFKLLTPEEDGKAIKVDQVRALGDFFAQSSSQGGRKVVILFPAEFLNNNAANALLKTLEEPTPGSVIILISHQSGMLLPTIRSRCQVVDFSIPTTMESEVWLTDYLAKCSEDLSIEGINESLFLAFNAPLTALNYIQEGAYIEYRRMIEELSDLLKNDVFSSDLAMRWNDDFALLRLSWMLLWLEQVTKLKAGLNISIDEKAQKMFSYLAKKADYDEILSIYELCLKQYRLFLGSSNPNIQLAFELLLHKWSQLMRK